MSDALSRRGKDLQGSPTAVPDSPQEASSNPQPRAQAGGGEPQVPAVAATQVRSQEASEPSPRANRPVEDPQPMPRLRGGASEEQEKLVSLYYPNSPQAKRIDILRSQLLFPFHGEPPRTIMITSSVPKEGRTLLATNLAISFARGLQQYVMVIDCHLGDPAVHSILNVPRQPGISDFLEHGATVPEIMHRTSVDKLTVIPAGTPSQRSSEILATDKMTNMLAELRERYRDRYMILDTPPVQAFDDPAVLARLVEGIVFVVMSGQTDRDLVLRGLRSLPEEKIVGVVLNDMNNAVSDAASLSSIAEEES